MKAEKTGRKWQKHYFSLLTVKVASVFIIGDFDMTEVVNSPRVVNAFNFIGYIAMVVLIIGLGREIHECC
jgi:steroid 5-alpha reductase family enzyme